MATFNSGGLTLAYDDITPEGGAPAGAVVLVHGFATNRAENWRRLGWYGAFERKGYRIVAHDARGHGESDKPHDPAAYGQGVLVDDILRLMDRAGLGRVDLMGYSMGARLSLAAAMMAPERFPLLILGGIGAKQLETHLRTDAMAQAMETADPESIENPLFRSFRGFADEQGEDRMALAALSRAQDAPFERSTLSALSMPVLVVAGARDELACDPEQLARAVPDGRAVTLPGCDHFSAIPHVLFKAAVFDFLDGTLE